MITEAQLLKIEEQNIKILREMFPTGTEYEVAEFGRVKVKGHRPDGGVICNVVGYTLDVKIPAGVLHATHVFH